MLYRHFVNERPHISRGLCYVEFNPEHHLFKPTLANANSCCNKSVPIYILTPESGRSLKHHIFDYAFSQWYQPGRNDIEYHQFIAQTIITDGFEISADAQPREIVDSLLTLHQKVCQQVEEAREAMINFDTQGGRLWPECARWNLSHATRGRGLCEHRENSDLVKKDQQYFVVQPTFRALTIAVCQGTYPSSIFTTEPTQPYNLPVLMMKTGVTEGLSAQISFDSMVAMGKAHGVLTGPSKNDAVYTTLGTAIDFVLTLEQREHAAFGPSPDPVLSTAYHESGIFNEVLLP